MVQVRSTPTARMRELAGRLRELRLERAMSIEDVAKNLLVSQSKISRLETAARPASPRDVRDLCLLYGVSMAERDRLMALATMALETSWYQDYDLKTEYKTYVGLEEVAREICHSQSLMVPGILQTPDYTRALAPAMSMPVVRDDAWVEDQVAVRSRRHGLLTSQNPPSVRFVVDEGMFRRGPLGPAGMAEQLARVLESAGLPNVTIQVVPLAVGAHPGMDGRFNVLRFEDLPIRDTVYVEGLLGELFLDKEEDVARYLSIFEYLSSQVALSPDATGQLLADIRDDWLSRT